MAKVEWRMYCSDCQQEIYKCDECDEFLDEDSTFICAHRGELIRSLHYCIDCFTALPIDIKENEDEKNE